MAHHPARWSGLRPGALALAWALRFFWGYWLALLAFWATRADALLAGQVSPTALLPGALRNLARVLPFRYMVGFPVEVLTEQLDYATMLTGFALQVGWLTIALALFTIMWREGLRRYTAVGG